MISWAYVNGQFTKEENALLHVRDLSVLRGYSVFDFFRFINFQPVFKEHHLARLRNSVQGLGLFIEENNKELEVLIKKLITLNEISEGGIRITVTGGISENGYTPSRSALVITQHNFDKINGIQFEKGLQLLSYEYQRQLPEIKTSDYIMGISLLPWIHGQKADDVLYMKDRIVSECPRSNIFIVNSKGQLCTPSRGILHGVTRKIILQVAQTHYDVIEKDISLDEVYQSREAFITSTTKSIFPVFSLDKIPIGTGHFTVGSHILQLYQEVSSVPAE
jgi:branched-chain amino acid aminotransferase